MRANLETVTHISLIVVSVVAGFSLLERRFAKPTPRVSPIQSLTKHQFKFAAPWQESDSTIVLALRPNAHIA